MRTYTIKPLSFSQDHNESAFESTPYGTLTISKPSWKWGGACWEVRYIPDHEAECSMEDPTPHPTFEAAVEAANEIHRKAVEKFLEPARVSVEPIGEQHKDGQHYLTDKGWAYWRVTYWCACNSDGEPYHYSDDGCYSVHNPTLVITIHP